MSNLMDGIFTEMNRARNLRNEYDNLPGGVGVFGSMMITQAIERAELSIRNNDVVAMLNSYNELKELQ